MSTVETPCDSCGAKPSFDVSYPNNPTFICKECLPYFASQEPHRLTDVDRRYVGDARKRVCRYSGCTSHARDGRALTIVRCERKRCGNINFHRLCFERQLASDAKVGKSRVVISEIAKGRTVKRVYCPTHADSADRQSDVQHSIQRRLQQKVPPVILPSVPKAVPRPTVVAEPAETEGAEKLEKSPKAEQKKATTPSSAAAKPTKPSTDAKARELTVAVKESKADARKRREQQMQQLLEGTEISFATDLLQRLRDMLKDENLEEVCANLEHYSSKVNLILAQLSPSSKCAVVGPTGAGKSFLINCLLACTAMPDFEYASNPARRKKKDGSIALEAFDDTLGLPRAPAVHTPAKDATAGPDPCVEGMKRIAEIGKLPANTPGWLLTSESLGDVTSRANVFITYGETLHFKVHYHTADEAKMLALRHTRMDPNASKADIEYAKSCWDSLVDHSKTPEPEDVKSVNDIVLKPGLPKLGSTDIFAGLGKSANVDRFFLREQLKRLNSRHNFQEQLLIKSITLYAPSAVLTHTRITDVMGSNDSNPVRIAKTQHAINTAHSLLVVMTRGLEVEKNVVSMLEDSLYLEQLLEKDSVKQLRFLIVIEKGQGVATLAETHTPRSQKGVADFLKNVEESTKRQLLKMLRKVIQEKTDSEPDAEAEERIKNVVSKRVSVTGISPALFWSLRLNRTGEAEDLRRTGLPRALGMFRYLDTFAILAGLELCTAATEADGKRTELEGSVVDSVIQDIEHRIEEFNDTSEEVKLIRETAEEWARPESTGSWEALKKNFSHQISTIHTEWRKAVSNQVNEFVKTLRKGVFNWTPAVQKRLQQELDPVTEKNKSILKDKAANGKIAKALFRKQKRIPFEELKDAMKKLFEGFLEKEFKALFEEMLKVIFDKNASQSKGFESITQRMWKVAKGQATAFFELLLFDPELKDNFESTRMIVSLRKTQLSALNNVQDACVESWNSMQDAAALRTQAAKDLSTVYENVCDRLTKQLQKTSRVKVNLFHELLFSKVDPDHIQALPKALQQAAESECLLHAILRTCVSDAQIVGAAKTGIDLPLKELEELKSNLLEWKKEACEAQQNIHKLLKNPEPWMERIGERLCGFEQPHTPARGPSSAAASGSHVIGVARPASSDSAMLASDSGAASHPYKKQKGKDGSAKPAGAAEDEDEKMPQLEADTSKPLPSTPASKDNLQRSKR